MSDFSRVNGAGWGVDDQLTSAQMNQLDIDHANALNRTGGNISGTVTVASGGSIVLNQGDQTVQNSRKITVTGSGSLLKTASGGRIQLGDGDFPTFSTARIRNECFSFQTVFQTTMAPPATIIDYMFLGSIQSATNADTAVIPLRVAHNGATLVSATVYFNAAPGYNGTFAPAGFPSFGLFRVPVSGGHSTGDALLSTGGGLYTFPSVANGTIYYAANAIQFMQLTTDQNNVIDTTQYVYFLVLYGETGAHYQAGTIFTRYALTYSIPDMAW